FFHSAERLRLPIGRSRTELKTLIESLQQHNDIPNSGIRMTLTGGYSDDGYSLTNPNLVITQRPIQMPSEEIFRNGMRLKTQHDPPPRPGPPNRWRPCRQRATWKNNGIP